MAVDFSKYKNLVSQSKSSPTYYGAAPTKNDELIQSRILSAKKQMTAAKDKELKKQYYGDEIDSDSPATQPKESLFKRVIGGLQMPLYGVAGVAESLTGTGTEKNVLKNIVSNIKEEEAFGSILRKKGVSGGLATGLGLAADIAMDPVNWMTMGTAALVPRVAKGIATTAKTGVIDAAKLGLKTGLIEKGLTLSKPITALAPKSKAASKIAEIGVKNIADKSIYNKLVGYSLEDAMKSKGIIGDFADSAIREVGKTEAGKKVGAFYEKFLEYSPTKWYQKRKALENTLKPTLDLKQTLSGENAGKFFQDFEPVVEQFRRSGGLSDDFEKTWGALKDANYNINKLVSKNASDIITDGAALATDDAYLARIFSADDKLKAMKDEFIDDLAVKMAVATSKSSGLTEVELGAALKKMTDVNTATGVDWYDDGIRALRDASFAGDKIKAKAVLEGYKTFIDVFKTSKIGGNLATHVLSVVGNTTMAGMYGLKFWKPAYLADVKAMRSLLSNKSELKTISDLFTNDSLRAMLDTNPDLMRAVFGIDLKTLLSNDSIDMVMKQYAEAKMIKTGLSEAERLKVFEGFKGEAKKVLSESLAKLQGQGATSPYMNILKGTAGADSTLISREMGSEYFKKAVASLEKSAADGNIGAKAIHWYLTKPIQAFEKIDQSFKLGTAKYLMNTGISESELLIMSRFHPLKLGEDVVLDTTKNLYKLNADAATSVVQDMYMNYAAMPAAIKVLRSVPFLGSPFASFSFAMLNKGIKTAAYNPSFYNKIQFTLDEINGGKSPLEKASLKKDYYAWYNKAGMVSLPFFKDNPIYLNAASFLPYLTMNIFEPSERKYGTGIGAEAAKLIDSSPFFKTPEGQLMMDYLIMPHLLGEATNMWGGQLWPSDATLAQKIGLAVRSSAETVLPPALGVAGIATPEAAMDYAPLYRWRQIGYAKEGKSSVGISGKESKTSRTARAILSTYAGINLYPLNITHNQ